MFGEEGKRKERAGKKRAHLPFGGEEKRGASALQLQGEGGAATGKKERTGESWSVVAGRKEKGRKCRSRSGTLKKERGGKCKRGGEMQNPSLTEKDGRGEVDLFS